MEKSDLNVQIGEHSINENVHDESADEEEKIVAIEDVAKNATEAIDLIPSIGRISLQFYNGICPSDCQYPKTYYTLNGKERLVLIYAENFRRQFIELSPHRNPLVLAVPNECEIQKFVSTTIRPSVFLFSELIDCWHGPAQFVADFICYESLEDQTALVSRYISYFIQKLYDVSTVYIVQMSHTVKARRETKQNDLHFFFFTFLNFIQGMFFT